MVITIFACWVFFMIFWSSVNFFFKIYFIKIHFRNTFIVSNRLDPDQDILSCLGPNCLQMLSADNKKERVNSLPVGVPKINIHQK